MSSDPKEPRGGVTIVGGRPMHRAVSVNDLPIGLEQALTVAAINPGFRKRFTRDPVKAAAKRGIELDEIEAGLLRSAGSKGLEKMVERMVVPPEMSRRHFVKNVSASVVAMVAGGGFLMCSGCTGAESWDSADVGEGAIEQWETLSGYTCYVYVPAEIAQDSNRAYPMLVCLHDEGEDCLANIQRWRDAADYLGFHLISVNWEPASGGGTSLVSDLARIRSSYLNQHGRNGGTAYLCGRGAGSAPVWAALNETDFLWNGAALLGGLPQGPVNPLAVDSSTKVYYLIGTQDPEYGDAVAFNTEVEDDIGIQFDVVTGTSDAAVVSFENIWQWLT